MYLTASPLNTAATAAFVGALATVGLVSHSETDVSLDASVIHGTFQANYEDAFKAANPLQEFAIGLSAAVKYGLLNQASDGAIIGKDGWLFTAEELETSAGFTANMQASAAYIAHVQAALASQDVKLFTVIVPDKAEVYQEYLASDVPEQVRARNADFLHFLDRIGIDRIDAVGTLTRAKLKGNVFMPDDTHWSPLGAKSIADAVAVRLADADIARAEVNTIQLSDTLFDGDLLAYTPTGALRPLVGPAQQTIERFETTVSASGGLFGDATVDVALVGTSFSAKPEWHFEGFLKDALQADILNVSREGQGPFAPMEAFLESDLLQANPPKIVIWEIPVRYVSKETN